MNLTKAQREYVAAKVKRGDLSFPIKMRMGANPLLTEEERVIELRGAAGQTFYAHESGAAFESSQKYDEALVCEPRAIQAQIRELFDLYGLSVAVGLTQHGIAIRSQDPRVDATNLGPLEPRDE